MPAHAFRPCGAPGGCPALVKPPDRYCEGHKHLANRYDQERGSAAKRGYTRRWQEYTKRFLRQPENMLCACGCGRFATDVDHITPVSGPDDPLFWEPTNHQGLAHECHARKTAKDKRKGLTRRLGPGG